ncbi:MAG: hypothetical protein HY574_08135 [candidate division NC10 bacterium]|nr:hypothetical protein [candidate division NC10 bacterium]
MKRSAYRQRLSNLALIPVLAISVLLPAVPSLEALEIIDPRSGRLFLTASDLTVQAGPVTLEIRRSLEDRRREPGLLGRRWRLNWESRLLRAGSLVMIEDAGVTVQFALEGSRAGYKTASGERVVFDKDGRATRTKLDGTKETFDAQGRLVERDYRNGNRVVFHYGPSGRLARIEGPRASHLRFTTDKTGRVTLIESSTGATVRYAYSNHELSKVQLPPRPPTRYKYYTGGELARIEDPQSGIVKFAYDFRGRVMSRSWADGSRERYEYDDTGSRLRYTDPLGGVTTTQWSKDKRRQEVTDPLGRTSVFEYDAAGRPLSVTGSTGATSRIRYDTLGRTLAVENSLRQATRFEYLGDSSWVKTITRSDGTKQVFEYDGHGNLTAVKLGTETVAAFTYHPDGSVASIQGYGAPERRFSYHQDGRLKGITGASGELSQFGYDRYGNPIKDVHPLGGITLRSYDDHNRLVSLTDPMGGVTRYAYDSKGRLIGITDPLGAVSKFEYDARGRLLAEHDPTGQTTRYQYDATGRLIAVTHPGNRTERFSYDSMGNMTKWTDGDLQVTSYQYGPSGELLKERSASGLEISYRYDPLGNLIAEERGKGVIRELKRDAFGSLLSRVDPLGASTGYQVDPLGRLLSLTDTLGRVKRFQYSGSYLTAAQEPGGIVGRYEYDPAGRLVEIRRPEGGVSRYAYDAMGHMTLITDPDGRAWRRSYDLVGRISSVTDPTGRVTHYKHDKAGRLVEKNLPDGKRISYQYDPLGRPISLDDGRFPVQMSYDKAGRLVKTDYPAIKRSLGYVYDPKGLRTVLTDLQGYQVKYGYDSVRRLSIITLPDAKSLSFEYDLEGRPTALRYPNGITGSWEYDGAGRIRRISYLDPKGVTLAAYIYGYDKVGNLVSIEDSLKGTITYQYDGLNQLTEEKGSERLVTYRYQPGGGRASMEQDGVLTRYRYDASDRLLEAGAERFGYDEMGNLAQRRSPGAATSYGYDPEGRLIKAVASDGATTTFGYTASGTRAWRRDQKGLTHFLYDGFDLIEEVGEDRVARAAYVYAPGIDRPLAMIREGKSYYYHPDRLGNIRLLTDDQGAIVSRYDYDPFGRIIGRQGSIPNPFTFTGREWDEGIGLYYQRARYYDPVLGRFLSPDPAPPRLSQPLTLNPYLYVRNNPLRYIDPMGLYEWRGDYVNLPDTAENIAKKIDVLERVITDLERPSHEAWARRLEEPFVDRWGQQDPGWPGVAEKYRNNVRQGLADAKAELSNLRARLPASEGGTVGAAPRTGRNTVRMQPPRPGAGTVELPRPGEAPAPGTEPGIKGGRGGLVLVGAAAALQLASCLELGKGYQDCLIEVGIGAAIGIAIAEAAAAAGLSVPVLLAAGGYGWVQVAGEGAQQVKDLLDRRQALAAQEAQQRKNLENMEQIIAGLERKADGQIAALRNKIDAALAKAQNAAQAAEQAATTASNLLGQLKGLAGPIAKASAACRAVEQLMGEVASRTANAKRYAERVEKGIEESWNKVKACQSTDEINKALQLASAAKPLAQGVAQNYRQAEEAMAKLRQIKAQSEQARRSLGGGQGILAQIGAAANSAADHLNEIRNQVELARGAFEGIMPLKTALLDSVHKIRAAFPADAAQVDQRLASLVERLQAKEYPPVFGRFIAIAEGGRNRAYEGLKFADALLVELKALPLCDAIGLPEGQIEEAARAIAGMGLGGLGEGIEERAKSCLARLRPPPSTATGKGDKPPDGGDGGETPPPLKRVLTRFGVFCSPSKIKVGQSASCRAIGEYSDKPDVNVDLTGVAAWSTGPTIIGDWPGRWRATATHGGASASATVTIVADEKKKETSGEQPGVKGAGEEPFGGGIPPAPVTSGAAGGGQPVEQPGLKPQPGTGEPPTAGTGGPSGPGAGQGVWCYFEQTPGMTVQYWQPEGPCPPMGRPPSDSRIPWQGLVPHGGGGGGGPTPPSGGGAGGGPKPPMGPKPSCGPATSCRCAGGGIGHIPCDRSKGPCHCGAS